MRQSLLILLCVGLGLGATACDRPTAEECQEACAHAKTLAKADYDAKTAALPEEVRRQGWMASASLMDDMVRICTAACEDVGDRNLVTCLRASADGAAWKACLAAQPQ